jgi:hypothetical protein
VTAYEREMAALGAALEVARTADLLLKSDPDDGEEEVMAFLQAVHAWRTAHNGVYE